MIHMDYRLFQEEKVVTRFILFLLLAVLEVSCSGNRQSLPQEKKPDKRITPSFVSFSEKSKEELKNFHVVLKTSLGDIRTGVLLGYRPRACAHISSAQPAWLLRPHGLASSRPELCDSGR